MWRYWKLGALLALGGLAFFDLATGMFAARVDQRWLIGVSMAVAVLPVVAWFWPRRWLAVLAAICSLVYTFTNPDPETNWGLVETAGLLGVLLVTTWLARSWRETPLVVLVLAAVVTQPFESLHGSGAVVFALILLVIGISVMAAVGYLRLTESARTRQFAAIRAEQRAEFARDLHDFVAHHVTGMVVLAQGARRIVERDPARAGDALERIEHAGGEAMNAMRSMVGMLRTPEEGAPIAPLAGISDLGDLVERFGEPQARLRVEGPVDDLPVEVTSSVHRVVMEALTNVRRHASEATRVDVSVLTSEDWVTVRVVNDGRPARGDGKGFGLLGLTERVQALGGRIKAGPGIDGGWVVDAALPILNGARTGA